MKIYRNFFGFLRQVRPKGGKTAKKRRQITPDGRPAAAAQEMSIDKDMDLAYDLKMIDSSINTRLKNGIVNGELKRMTP